MTKNLIKNELFRCFKTFPFIFLCFCLICAERFLDKYFGNVSANEFIFFLQTPMEGVDQRLLHIALNRCLLNPLIYALLVCLMPYVFLFICAVFHKKSSWYEQVSTWVFLHIKKYFMFIFFVSVIICGIMLKKIEFIPDLYKTLKSPYSTFYENHYTESKADNISFDTYKNLIVLHVESMEKTFANKNFFKSSLIPELEALETDGVQFDNYLDGYGTGYTAGSLIALFTGIPVNMLSHNFVSYFGNRLKIANKIYSLGKILKDNGYETIMILGTDGDFAGQQNFLKAHGVDNVMDSVYINQIFPHAIQQSWGYDDTTLFEAAREFLSARTSKSPYFMLLQTADTHTGFLTANPTQQKFKNPYYNQIYHSDSAIADFIKWLQLRPDYKNTVIVIVGDHLRMGNDFEMPQNRKIFNLFLNTPIPYTIHRTFTQIDLFPSIIEAMGGQIKNHRLGLGVSVFSNQQTLAEQYSEEYLQTEFSKRSKLSEEIWKE